MAFHSLLDGPQHLSVVPDIGDGIMREYRHDERILIRLIERTHRLRKRSGIQIDGLLLITDVTVELLDLQFRRRDLRMLRLHFGLRLLYREIERVDGRLQRLLLGTYCSEFCFELRDVLIEGCDLRLMGVDLGLEFQCCLRLQYERRGNQENAEDDPELPRESHATSVYRVPDEDGPEPRFCPE